MRPKPARIRQSSQPMSPQEQDFHDRLARQRQNMRASRCPTCGNEPVEARARWQQRQDLAITWLCPDPQHPSAVVERHHCAQCQPHQHIQAIACPLCGDGPIVAGALADATPDEHTIPAPVRQWLEQHGWSQDPEHAMVCPDHQPVPS
ncbi:hypothetical protein [Amycolatopsis taiwanensis]|uniref:hypothetical protein n=1 Tax=Amycolatopsis taiwanensis TaxID=342230 RepID=UPI002554F7EC|nr:hypothetical protein [Amycolatopsis taiwanensis]